MRDWAERVIWEEAREFLGSPLPRPQPLGDVFIQRQRALRAEGLVACPTCLSRLLTDLDFAREQTLRRAWLEELRAKEGAC